jgi:hypothetical protein
VGALDELVVLDEHLLQQLPLLEVLARLFRNRVTLGSIL